MNKACERCGRIIVVPDIPLPQDYTQKCPACGFDNPITDDYSPSAAKPAPNYPQGGMSQHFDNAIDNIFASSGAVPPQPAAKQPSRPAQPSRPSAPPAAQQRPAPVKAAPQQARPAGNLPPQIVDSLRRDFLTELERCKADLRQEMEGRLRMLEDRLKSQTPGMNAPTAGDSPKVKALAFQAQVHERLLENQVLVATQNATVIKNCEATLQRRGFTLNPVTSLEATLEQISKKPYHVIIVDQRMLKYASDSQALLGRIKQISLPIRRCQTIAMITPGITTAESQVFYQWGIDINIHTKDLERLDEILVDILELKEVILNEYIADMYAYT